MNKKYVVFGGKTEIPKEAIAEIRKSEEQRLLEADIELDKKVNDKLNEEDNLVHTEGRIVVKLDMKNKDFHVFESGLKIKRERAFNNFNRRETQPVNCIVISGAGIPKGAELLVEHNAFHETNRINDYKNSFENEASDRVRYFSLERYECYCWRIGSGEWHPIYPYEFALRVFKPYKGMLQGIEPELLKDTLFVTSGNLRGKVVKTLKACDYELVYQDLNGREAHLICFRPNGDDKRKLEEEAIAILWDETKKVLNAELLTGYSLSDFKK